MIDLQLTNPKLFNLIKRESTRQIDKWGVQDRSSVEWLSITAEEFEKLAKAINERYFGGGSPEDIIEEAIHTATLSLKIAEMFLVLKKEE